MISNEEWLKELHNINQILPLIQNSEVLEIAQNYIRYIQGKVFDTTLPVVYPS